jgi:signal peptidase II
MKKNLVRWLALFALLLAGCRADQATKAWASSALQDEPRTLIPNLLEFRYAENRAIAFSMLRGIPEDIRRPLIFALGGISLAALLTYGWMRRRAGAWSLVPFALILAGGFGNFQDRIFKGYVVDFVHVHWKDGWSFPIFNLADSFVSVGMALLLLQGFLERKEEETPDAAQSPTPAV